MANVKGQEDAAFHRLGLLIALPGALPVEEYERLRLRYEQLVVARREYLAAISLSN
jgi:hypothetical protein